jgi:DNA polymerase III subunit delta
LIKNTPMPTTPIAVLNDLKAGKYAPVYFLQGDEPFFIDQIVDFIEKNAIPERDKGFNQVILYGKETPMNVILSNARRFPMMADRQVVIVKEAQGIYGLGREETDEFLIQYLQNPLPSTILVFSHKYKSLDGKKKLSKELEKKAVLVKSDKIPEYKLNEWIDKYVKEKGHSIDSKSQTIIAESIGNNLEVLTNEIDKMLINFSTATAINPQHIQQYIGINKEYNIFEMTKALSYRDIVKVNKIVQYFGQNKKSQPLVLTLPALYNYFMKILVYHANKNMPESQLAGKMGVNPYFMKEYKQAAANYPVGKLFDNIGYIKEADLRSKGVDTSGMEENTILKELVFKLMH